MHYSLFSCEAWCCLGEVPYRFRGYASNFKATRLKISSILTQIGRFRTVTPVWIHWWLWNNAQNLKQHRRGALLFFKVFCQISRSHLTKKISPILTRIERFQALTLVRIQRWSSNDAQSLTWYKRAVLLFFEVIHQISSSHGLKKSTIWIQIE